METDYLFPAEIRGMLRIIRILEHSNIRFWTNPFYCKYFSNFWDDKYLGYPLDLCTKCKMRIIEQPCEDCFSD